ncbi:MAG: VWA domain-containing protein [Spirochaeta sp.]|nr:VWA domain-containing protein [Spirochaeta sp.]
MNLGNPGFLWLLFLLPLIIILHLVRKKRPTMMVSSLLFWEQVVRENNSRLLFRRFRRNLPLLFQLLAVALLILSLADPFVLLPHEDKNVIMILDTTASMKAEERGGVRYEEARSRALAVLADLGKSSQMLIIESGSKPRLKSSFIKDRIALRGIIDEYTPTDEAGDMSAALVTALAFAREDDQIMVVTDGAYDDLEVPALKKRDVSFELVGEGGRNSGITQFQFRQTYGSDERFEVLITVANFSRQPVEAQLELFMDRSLIFNQALNLGAGEEKNLIFPYSGIIGERAEVFLDYDDDLEVDNHAYAVFSSIKEIQVLLVGEDNIFLRSLLESYPRVVLTEIKEAEKTFENMDVHIFDGAVTPFPLKGNIVLINTLAADVPIKLLGQVYAPGELKWQKNHPLMSSLELADLNIFQAQSVAAGKGVETLLDSGSTPLISLYEEDDLKLIHIGFDFRKSDFPLRVAFPVFWGNIFNWFYSGELVETSSQVQTGEPLPVSLSGKSDQITVHRPDGRVEMLEEYNIFYTDTRTAGFYRVAEGPKSKSFAVNLLNHNESNIIPRYREPGRAEREKEGRASGIESIAIADKEPRSLWKFAALLVLLFLLAEWYFWVKES